MQRLDRPLGAVLIEEAEPDAQAADQKDDQRVEALADKERGQRGSEQQHEQRVAQLAGEHRERPRAVTAKRVRSCEPQPPLCLRTRESLGAGIQACEHLLGGSRGGRGEAEREPVRRCNLLSLDGQCHALIVAARTEPLVQQAPCPVTDVSEVNT